MSRPPPIPKRPPRPATPVELRDAIRDEALRLGFDAVGFAPAGLAPEARRERLQRLSEFVEAGWQGDMGWLGKHTNLVSRQFGSWLFLGEILLSVELPADAPETDHCGHCRAAHQR